MSKSYAFDILAYKTTKVKVRQGIKKSLSFY